MQGSPRSSRTFFRRITELCLLFAFVFSCGAAGIDFEMRFLRNTGQVTNRTFNTITGPTDGQRLFAGIRMIPSGEAGIFIGVDRQAVLMITSSGGEMNEAEANPEIGDWPMDVTYDSQGHRVALVTLGGEGALYSRPSGNNQWFKIASMNNVDLESLVYWAVDNSF